MVAEFRNNLSVPSSEVNLKLHHDYTEVSKQPFGSIFTLQPGTSPLLYRGFGVTYRSYGHDRPGTSPRLYQRFGSTYRSDIEKSTWNFTTNIKNVNLLKYILSHLNTIYTFYQFP